MVCPLIPVVCAIQVLIPPRQVTPHLVRPSEKQFILNPIYNLVYRLLECYIHPPICASSSCILKSFLGLEGKMPYRERFSNKALPLFYNRSSLRHLYSSICLISCLISSGGLFVNDSRSSESLGNPILKVLATIFSLPPSISLYSSQYRLA